MPNIGQQHSIEKSRQLQRNLYLAAKKDKQRRFHALYDRIFRLDILWRAWKEVRENKRSAGIDGITFEMIEEYGVEEYLFIGKPCEGEPHARFEVAGDGNGNYRAIA